MEGRQKESKQRKRIVHLGSLCELIYLKGSELPKGHKDRKLQGRIVFLGDRVRGQFGLAAIFEELSSSPAGMEASRFCDFYGRCFGNVIDQADAVQAYTQSELPPGTTYIKLPGRYRKELLELGLIEDDNDMYVIPVDKAVCGQPQSGAH